MRERYLTDQGYRRILVVGVWLLAFALLLFLYLAKGSA